MTSTEPRTEQASDKVSLPTLTAMVVGSMIGSGVFLLPRRFGTETGVLGAIIAWTIAIIAFKADVFADNFWGGAEYSMSSAWDQATGTMLITVFVFLGIEGASVYSRMHASERTSAGQPSSGF
jgi:amino acid transporter